MHNNTYSLNVKILINLVTIVLVTIFVFCGYTLAKDNTYNKNGKVTTLNDNWVYNNNYLMSEDNVVTISEKEQEDIIISRIITEQMLGQTLEFKTNHKIVEVFINNKNIYSVSTPNNEIVNTPGIVYNFVKIPIDCVGQEIKIHIKEFYNDTDDIKLTFLLGDKQDISGFLLHNLLFDIVANFIIIVLGAVLLLVYMFFKRYIKESYQILLLAMFSLSVAIWSISETYILYFLVPNPSVVYLICYGSLFAIPIYLMLFMRNQIFDNIMHNNKAKIIDALAAIHAVVIAVLYALQIFDIADFTHSVIIFHILMFTEIFVLAIINYLVMAKKAIKRALQLLPYILLGTSFVIDFNMFLHNSDHTWTLARIWVYLYLLNTVRQYVKFFLTDAVDAIESKYLKEIAYTDVLTGIKNRNAFVSELQTSNLETSSIISFDVNGLKYYNDNFGHDKGDELLTSMSDTLKKVFNESVYRMGGDEFIVLLDTVDKGKIVEMLEKFENEIEAFNKQNKIVLQSAYGYSIYEKGKTYDDMIKEADRNMYICKRKQKGIN